MPTSRRATGRRPARPEQSSAARAPHTMRQAENASGAPAQPPRERLPRRGGIVPPRPTTGPAHPPGGADQCRCRARDAYPVLHVDYTHGTEQDPPAAHLRHDPTRCGLPPTPYTLRSQT
jgi:hypothetical protein